MQLSVRANAAGCLAGYVNDRCIHKHVHCLPWLWQSYRHYQPRRSKTYQLEYDSRCHVWLFSNYDKQDSVCSDPLSFNEQSLDEIVAYMDHRVRQHYLQLDMDLWPSQVHPI